MSSLPPIDPVLLRPVDELKVTTPILDLLKATNIYYVGDLAQRTETQLRQRGFSSRTIAEIRTALWSRGLDLSKD